MKIGTSNRSSRTILFGNKSSPVFSAAQEQDQQLLEKDNDQKIEELKHTVSNIKNISHDIERGIKESNDLIDTLDTEMGGVQGLLNTAKNKLSKISQQGGNRHMCYLALFVFFVFVVLYFIITMKSK